MRRNSTYSSALSSNSPRVAGKRLMLHLCQQVMQGGQQRCAVVFTVILGKNAANQRPNLGFLRRMSLYFLCVLRDLQQDSPLLAAHVDIVNLARGRVCQAIFGVFRGTFIRLPERLTQQNQGVTRIRRFPQAHAAPSASAHPPDEAMRPGAFRPGAGAGSSGCRRLCR